MLNQSADGNCNKLIARNLGVSVATVKFHLSNVYRKLGVGSRTVAVAVARENNSALARRPVNAEPGSPRSASL